jgi:hypothetical protein
MMENQYSFFSFSPLLVKEVKMTPDTQIAIIMIIVILVGIYIFFNYQTKPSIAVDARKTEVSDNLTKMRRLWTESNYLTRSNTIEHISGYQGANATHEKVFANVNQIGRNIGTLYGALNGDKAGDILRQRHTHIMNIITLARQNKDISSEVQQLKDTNDALTQFLVSLNPVLDEKMLSGLVQSHTDHLIRQISHISKHECSTGTSSFDASNKSLQELMDYLETSTWSHLIGGPRY